MFLYLLVRSDPARHVLPPWDGSPHWLDRVSLLIVASFMMTGTGVLGFASLRHFVYVLMGRRDELKTMDVTSGSA